MPETANIREERIQRLLDDLQYEVKRGMMEGDVEETIGYTFYVPISKHIPDGVVLCEFHTNPIPRHAMNPEDLQPRLKLVEK